MKKKPILFTLSLFLMLSCSSPKEEQETFESICFKNEYVNLQDSLDIQFISLETSNESLIGLISNIKIVDDRIFIYDQYKMKEIFVFDMKGSFISKVGERGAGPSEYAMLTDFDIEEESHSIILADRKSKLLFYDLESFDFKYKKNTDFSYFDFIPLPNNQYAFFYTDGFENMGQDKNHFILVTDSSMNPTNVYYPAEFTTPIMVRGAGKNFYKSEDRIFAYNHLLPYVYEMTNNTFTPMYKLNFESFEFPTIDFLKHETKNYGDYTKSLSGSGFISSVSVFETKDMIWIQIIKSNQPFIGFYNKKTKNGYVLSLKDYFESMGLGALVFPKGYTDDYIICEMQLEKNTSEYVKNNPDLIQLIQNKKEEENPILCLIKLKQK